MKIIRIIVGVLFIFSGLIKVNDPTGLGYKMEEFFDVWGMGFLDSFSLAFAFLMNIFEIVAGVAILIGWRMKLFSWLLLLLIIFFTFLTGYAMFSDKIKTCGCFGDCIRLTPAMSFTKDLILTALILIIFFNRNKIKASFGKISGTAIIVLTTLFCIIAQWHVLKHLPVIDCLAYKKGINLLEQMKTPAGALPDSFVTKFVYTKNNKKLEFDADSLPADLDSTYIFVDRTQKLVRAATGIPPITDFILYSENGTDTTQAILNQKSKYVMLLMKDAAKAGDGWAENAKAVSKVCAEENIPFFVVTGTTEAAQKQLPESNTIHYLKCDVTVIKTAARVNPAYFVMDGAVVKDKVANVDFEKVVKEIGQ